MSYHTPKSAAAEYKNPALKEIAEAADSYTLTRRYNGVGTPWGPVDIVVHVNLPSEGDLDQAAATGLPCGGYDGLIWVNPQRREGQPLLPIHRLMCMIADDGFLGAAILVADEEGRDLVEIPIPENADAGEVLSLALGALTLV